MLGRRLQFSLRGLFLLVALVAIGCRCATRVVYLHERAVAHHCESDRFIALTNRFPIEDEASRRYCWHRAWYHLSVATDYDWAIYNPWLSVNEPSVPPLPPAVARLLTAA